MDINYELYKVFYYVASTLSFSEASKQLFISQSAVSQSIKALEKKLDQTLFIRSTKKVRLTTEGEILLRHIEPAISLIKRGESQLLDVGARGGQLHIGASDTICRYFLVPYLERFHREFPGAHIKVTNATSIRCVELLETGQVDLIVVNSPNAYLGNVPSTKKTQITAWWDKAVDIIPLAGGKGNAVNAVLAHYGFSKEEAIAFGDGKNDIEMLEAVGMGVAMENAKDEVKQRADAICKSVEEDGVYDYCVRNHLIAPMD